MTKRNWQKEDGKPARLPIIRKLVEHGEDRVLRLDENDVTKCWRCGSMITIRRNITTQMPDGMEYVECTNCHIRISALYCWENAVYLRQKELDREERTQRMKESLRCVKCS